MAAKVNTKLRRLNVQRDFEAAGEKRPGALLLFRVVLAAKEAID